MYVRLAYRWRGVVILGYGDRMTPVSPFFWNPVAPGIYEHTAIDGSVWRYDAFSSEVSEMTEIHPRNLIGYASMKQLAAKEVKRLLSLVGIE
jgi:hypothetical protein